MSALNRYTLGVAVALGLIFVSGAALRHTKRGGTSKALIQTRPNSAAKFPSSVERTAKAHIVENYGKVPLSFEANRGQTDERVKFLTRGPGYALFLTGNEAVLSLSSRKAGVSSQRGGSRELSLLSPRRVAAWNKGQTTTDVLRMKLVGVRQAPEPEGFDELSGKVNYFIGNDPKKWRSNVPTYAKVRYKDVYPGIDLVYYGRQGQLEYDFIVSPEADPRQIALNFEGSKDQQRLAPLHLDKNGNVLVKSSSSVVRLTKPVIYQQKISSEDANSESAQNSKVEGRFVVTASNQIRFDIGPYDKSRPLVIDPGLVYSTFLGFSGSGASVAVNSSGNVFIAGPTNQPNFPVTPGAFNTTAGVAYVAKLNSTGSALIYSTYFGGTTNSGIGGEVGPFLALDSSDNVYLTGYTTATDFPVTPGAFQTKLGNPQGSNPFVSKLNPAGSKLIYSTYLGGTNGIDVGEGITVDSSGDAYVVGLAGSSDFPTKPGAFQTVNNGGASPGIGGDGFVTEVKPDGTDLVFSTFLGGPAGDIATSVVVDSTGAIYVGGSTFSTDFPIKNPLQPTLNGNPDGFTTKFAPGGSTLDYSTYGGQN